MLRLQRIFMVACALVLSVAITAPVLADDKQSRARQVTQDLLTNAHTALTGTENGAALRSAISRAFNFETWERFLIQNREDAFNETQRTQFRALLPGFLAHLYHQQFAKGLDQAPTLGDARKVRRDVLVSSTFLRPNGRTLPVDWRVRDFPDQGAQVIDIMVAGTSFLLLKRDEFTAIVDNGGAEAVLTYMQRNSY